MIFIHAAGIHNTMPRERQPDLAEELHTLTGKIYRRTDHFIQLAILGAHKAAGTRELPAQTAIYLTSGQGNISVFTRICEQRRQHNLLPKPVDFINLLSNSAGFYVASHLALDGKNLFVTHHHFPAQMALLAAQNDLRLGRQKMVLLGGVDEWIPRQDLARKLLGVSPSTQLGEGSNWLLLNSEEKNALATVEVHPQLLSSSLLAALLSYAPRNTSLIFSHRFDREAVSGFMRRYPQCRLFSPEEDSGYYETHPLFTLSSFLRQEKGRLIHIDTDGNQYMIVTLANDLL